MYIVFLRFSANRSSAGEHMPAHVAWLQRGLDDRVFLVVGSVQQQGGGVVIAHGITREALDARIREDPFVVHRVVEPEVVEVSPSRADPRVAFLLA